MLLLCISDKEVSAILSTVFFSVHMYGLEYKNFVSWSFKKS